MTGWYLRAPCSTDHAHRAESTVHRHTAPRLERLAHRHPARWGDVRRQRAQASSDELRRAQRPAGAPPFILASNSAISGKTGWSSSPSRKRCSPGWSWVGVGLGLGSVLGQWSGSVWGSVVRDRVELELGSGVCVRASVRVGGRGEGQGPRGRAAHHRRCRRRVGRSGTRPSACTPQTRRGRPWRHPSPGR